MQCKSMILAVYQGPDEFENLLLLEQTKTDQYIVTWSMQYHDLSNLTSMWHTALSEQYSDSKSQKPMKSHVRHH